MATGSAPCKKLHFRGRMKKRSSFMCLFLLLVLNAAHAESMETVLFDGKNAADTYRLAALTLAGIVNRDGAELYLANVREAWSYAETDETWEKLYHERGGVTFTRITSFADLVERYRSRIKGVITYEPRRWGNFSGQSFFWQGEYAALIGGLTGCLPLPEATARALGFALTDSVLVEDAYDGDPPVRVPARLELKSHPWNDTSQEEERRYLALVDWGLRTLLPLCNPDKCYIREITDFTIHQRMFQLNLAGDPPGGVNFLALPAARVELLERLLTFMQNKNPDRIFHVYGWMDPEPLVQWIATFGGAFHETLQNNLSWHAAFPAERRPLVPPAQTGPEQVQLEDKYYLVFVSSEGDASNWALTFQAGAWLSPHRGSVPISWGWNLHLFDLCPFIARYYYDTATANDGFVSVMSPLGYVYPDLWDENVWPDAVGQTRRLMEAFGIRDFYAYKHYAPNGRLFFRGVDLYNSFDFNRLGRFLGDVNAQLTLLYDPQLANQYPTTRYGALLYNHVNDGTFYGDTGDLDAMARRILNSLKGKAKPGFLLAGYQRFFHDDHGSWPAGTADLSVERLGQVVQKLQSDPVLGKEIEVVTIEKFSALLRKKLSWSGVAAAPTGGVTDYHLLGSYPNPFNSRATLCFTLDRPQRLTLAVFDLRGREMLRVMDEEAVAGTHRRTIDAAGWPSGVYIARLAAGPAQQTLKLILAR